MKFGENEVEPFRLFDGACPVPGLLGIVPMVDWRLECVGPGGKEETKRGEDCAGVLCVIVAEGRPPLTPALRGMICRLAERVWPLVGRLGLSGFPTRLAVSPTELSLAPIDTIDIERLCVPPTEVFGRDSFWDPASVGSFPVTEDVFNERVVRWPLLGTVGLRLALLMLLFVAADCFRCLSIGGMWPFVPGGCRDVFEGVADGATFLNVISHSIFSPANTVGSFHCTKTLILLNGVDMSSMTWRQ